jgi:hypothetical protein
MDGKKERANFNIAIITPAKRQNPGYVKLTCTHLLTSAFFGTTIIENLSNFDNSAQE